ncbi:hypothetical protein GVAV_000701 [Gurleya vavrai]
MTERAEQYIDRSTIDNGLRKAIQNDHSLENITKLSNEALAYADHISSLLPENIKFDKKKLFTELKNGIILAHVLFELKNGCIDLRKLVYCDKISDKKNVYESTANLSIVLNSVKKLGIKVVNIGPEDILYENKSLVLGLLWQIVRLSVSKGSNVLKKPELITLLHSNESIDDLCAKSPEELCLRWINFHLSNAMNEDYVQRLFHLSNTQFDTENEEEKNKILESVFKTCYNNPNNKINIDEYKSEESEVPKNCRNFSKDIVNSKIYLLLMKQIAGDIVSFEDVIKAWIETDLLKRAEHVITIAERINCKEFVTAQDIVKGDHRLNFLFCQTLMNKYAGMESKTVDIDILKEQRKEFEETICKLMEKTKALTEEINKKNECEKELVSKEKELKEKLEARSEEFNIAIEDLRLSMDCFSHKITSFVEEKLDISLPKERTDAKEKIWEIVKEMLSDIEKCRKERDDARFEVQRLREIGKKIELKSIELVKIQRQRKLEEKKKGFNIRDFCGCNK